MADRVVRLVYEFRSENERVRFTRAKPASGSFDAFAWTLADGLLTATPSHAFRTVADAQEALEVHLRTWEQVAFLAPQRYRIRFVFRGAELESIDPSSGSVTAYAETASGHAEAYEALAFADNGIYPEPPAAYRRSALTDQLTERIRRVVDGEASVTGEAYFLLTAIEANLGVGCRGNVRAAAAGRLGVSRAVLDTLGALADRRDPELGRKAASRPERLSDRELEWLRAAMIRLTVRVGELEASIDLDPITMDDLPKLNGATA